jgi:hypothetical protein
MSCSFVAAALARYSWISSELGGCKFTPPKVH